MNSKLSTILEELKLALAKILLEPSVRPPKGSAGGLDMRHHGIDLVPFFGKIDLAVALRKITPENRGDAIPS